MGQANGNNTAIMSYQSIRADAKVLNTKYDVSSMGTGPAGIADRLEGPTQTGKHPPVNGSHPVGTGSSSAIRGILSKSRFWNCYAQCSGLMRMGDTVALIDLAIRFIVMALVPGFNWLNVTRVLLSVYLRRSDSIFVRLGVGWGISYLLDTWWYLAIEAGLSIITSGISSRFRSGPV